MHIDDIQKLVGASTPGKAVEKVRELIEGFPADDPPDDSRDVLTYSPWHGYQEGFYVLSRGWYFYTGAANSELTKSIVRWWELPVSPRNN